MISRCYSALGKNRAQPVLDKPFTIFLFAVVPSAALVCGVALLLQWPAAMPGDVAPSSTHAKLARPTARIDPISALIAPAQGQAADPDQTASAPSQPETVTGPDRVVPVSVEDDSDSDTQTGETNVALNSAPDAVSPLSEGNAPEKAETIDQADPTGGGLDGEPKTPPSTEGVPQSVSRPSKKPNGSAYGAGVYAALARHKPTAGERGRTTVTFDIGASGALGDVRVGQSSGSAQLDQIALQTVRNAAPFPPPPDGPASYTIQIDFR